MDTFWTIHNRNRSDTGWLVLKEVPQWVTCKMIDRQKRFKSKMLWNMPNDSPKRPPKTEKRKCKGLICLIRDFAEHCGDDRNASSEKSSWSCIHKDKYLSKWFCIPPPRSSIAVFRDFEKPKRKVVVVNPRTVQRTAGRRPNRSIYRVEEVFLPMTINPTRKLSPLIRRKQLCKGKRAVLRTTVNETDIDEKRKAAWITTTPL